MRPGGDMHVSSLLCFVFVSWEVARFFFVWRVLCTFSLLDVPCDHGLGFDISLLCENSINQLRHFIRHRAEIPCGFTNNMNFCSQVTYLLYESSQLLCVSSHIFCNFVLQIAQKYRFRLFLLFRSETIFLRSNITNSVRVVYEYCLYFEL